MIKTFLVKHFPALGRFKRLGKAWYNNVQPVRPSYSQYGEDKVIVEFLAGHDLQNSIYVDVGANHPSDISNSYLLYRKGFRGIVVEPNEELIGLFKNFRPEDIALAIGCSNENTILPFHISKTPVLSSFADAWDENVYKTLHLPVMRLDDAIRHVKFDFISLLSVDVEGLNCEVLEGACDAISKALLVCLECDTDQDRQKFNLLLGNNFELYREMGCNLLFVNKVLSQRQRIARPMKAQQDMENGIQLQPFMGPQAQA